MIDTAVIVVPRDDRPAAGLCGSVRVAGLDLVVRAALTARYAGIEWIAVAASKTQWEWFREAGGDDPRLKGCVVRVDPDGPSLSDLGRCLILAPEVVLTTPALRSWLDGLPVTEDLVVSGGGEPVPLVAPATCLPALIAAARDGVEGLEALVTRSVNTGTAVVAPWTGLSPRRLRSASDVADIERAMLRALRTPEDGPLVDRYFNRTLSAPLTRFLVRTPVTPNQLTVVSLCLGLLAAALLAQGERLLSILGLLVFQASVILDHSDGEVARLRFQFTPLGKRLDNWSDHAVDLAVIVGLAWQTAGAMSPGQGIGLGAAAALGVTGSFLVVFFWTVGGGGAATAASAQGSARTLMAMANRDGFYLALWGAVLIGQPTWFLWALALGANAYWIAWLLVCGVPSSRRSDA